MNQRPANQRLEQAVRTICGRHRALSVPAVALFGFSMVSVALAGPTGGVVVNGEATISTPAAGRTVIDQASQHVQLNWNTFDVGANESVQFHQPSSSSVALNRILDQNPSQIFGRIDANGQVILVNPNGMLFGRSAQLNVGSLVASSLDVIGFDAATGRYTFGTSRTDVGAIVNDGAISAARGGSVTLLGGRVANNGSIIADFGTVNLAAGRAATLDLAGDGLLRLEVDGELLSNNAGASAAVENGGVIEATGGQVLLTAQAVDDVFANLVNNTGVVRANRIDNSGGTIRLMGAGGTVRSSGVLDASAGDVVSGGGTVEMLGKHVGLFESAVVDVSGATSGGTALIGGDYQGKNPNVLNAERTYVSSDANIRADAGLSGDGGRVIVWADEITRFSGSISARGGALSGNGGFAEVSGKEHLVFQGRADLTAANGSVGTLLLDPTNITIDNSGATEPAIDDGTYAFAEDAGDATIGNATIEALLATSDVVLQATHNIDQDADATIDVSGVAGASGNSLTLEAGENITLNGSIIMNDGAVILIADSADAPDTGGDGTGAITMADGSSIDAGSGAVTFTAAEDIRVTAITTTGAVSLTSSDGAILNDGDSATLISGGAVTLSGSSIGTALDRIDTDATSVDATSSNGGVFITEADALTLTASATGGAVNVQTTDGALTVTSAAGNGVTLIAGGAGSGITLNGAVNAGAGNVTLTAGTSASRGAIVAGGGNQVTGGSLTVTGSAIGGSAARLNTNVGSLTATATNGGIFVTEANGLTLANVSAAGAGSDVDVTSTTGNIVVNTVTAADAVTLTATAGAITDDGNDATRINAQALTLSAGTAIGATGTNNEIDTNVTSLTATAAAGGVYIGELDGLTLTNVSAAGAGNDVSVTSTTGNIVVNTVTAADAVTLTATAGAITDDGNDATRISAQALTLSAGTAIGATGTNNQIDTNVTSLTATAAAGGVYIGELDGLTLTNVSAAGAGNDVSVTSTTGNIVVNTVTAADAVTLTATAGAITDDGNDATRISAQTLTLSAGTAIGATGTNNEIDTNVASLTATAAAGGVYIGELDGLTLTNVSAAGAGNDVSVTSTTGNIIVNTVTAANAVTLTASAGAITDDGNDATRINAQALTLSAGTAIGATGTNNQIDTNVASLTATAAAGGVYIGETNGLTLTNVSAAGAGSDVSVTSTTGNIIVNTVTAADAVTLTATAGAITDDGNDATMISGSSVSLAAATNIGTVVDFGAANDADVGSSVDVQTNGALTASVTSNSGQINLNISGAPTLAAGAITLGSGSNRSGAIVLQSAGNLNVAGLTPGAINIGSNNTTMLGLRSGGVLTLPSSGGFTDQPVDQLLVRGATDVVDSDGTPREFSLTATALDFRSGAAGGATILNTDVARLNATVGNDQNLTINEASGLTLGTLNAGNGNITLTAAGAVLDDADDSTRIVANTASLSGTSLGAAGNALDTRVNTLSASASNGGVYINEFDALALTVSATGGAADVRTADGSLTVATATGNGVTLIAGGDGSNITLNGAVNAGAGDVTLTAGTLANRGAIIAGAGHHITGNALAANGSAIGTSAARVNTSVASVDATSTNGGIFITESDALSLAANASGGAVDVATTNGALTVTQATGSAVTLAAGGNGSGITLNGAVNAGAGDVTLTAGTPASRGAIVAGAGGQVTGSSLTATGASIGTNAARLNTTVASLDATSTNGGIFVTETDALNLTASATNGIADVRTTNGALTVTSVNGEGVTLAAGGAGNGITLNGAVNAGAGDVILTAGTPANRGAIIAGAGHHITGGALTAAGSSIGTSAARLNTTVVSVDATSTNGGIFISETDALNLTATATGGMVDLQTGNGSLTVASVSGEGVTLTAGGDGSNITLNGAVNAGAGDVTLTAGTPANRGAIIAGAVHHISGNALTAIASTIGTSAARVNTSVVSLDATSTNGGIVITESDALSLAANASGGAVDVATTNGALTVTQATGNAVMLTAGGNGSGIALNGAVNAGAGDVTLTAGTPANRGAIVAGAGSQVTGSSLTATGASIGTGSARLNTTVASLNATSTNGGIFVTETDALNLTGSATGGAVDVQTGNGSLTVGALSGDGVTLTAGGAGSGITLNGALNAGGGDIALTAGTTASRGAIVGSAGHSISGRTLTATAAAIGASNARLNTSIDTLNAVATTGDVYISEQNGLTLASVSAARDIGVSSASGDIVVNTVAAANAITLTATAGAIADDGDDSTRLSANALTLRARSIGAASTLSGQTLNSSARLDTDVETLNATATAGGIFIEEANGLQNVSVQASGGEAGDIELLTLAGDLNLQQVNASDTLLLAAGRNIFALPGASPVTARVAEVRAGTTDAAGGQIGRTADPIDFQLGAGNSLRLFVPQTINPDDPNRAPATKPFAGVTTTLSQFGSGNTLAALAGFNQFLGFGEIQFTSPAEALVRSLQSQTGTVQAGLDIDWGSFDPDVSLFGTLEPSVCLPGDQRDEEDSTPNC